jgi:hypothetical protein
LVERKLPKLEVAGSTPVRRFSLRAPWTGGGHRVVFVAMTVWLLWLAIRLYRSCLVSVAERMGYLGMGCARVRTSSGTSSNGLMNAHRESSSIALVAGQRNDPSDQ